VLEGRRQELAVAGQEFALRGARTVGRIGGLAVELAVVIEGRLGDGGDTALELFGEGGGYVGGVSGGLALGLRAKLLEARVVALAGGDAGGEDEGDTERD
jgi:hypothetical protein